jgi:hypothetical protein
MLIIDRFEGDYAVCECETGEFVNIRRNLIAEDAGEGDIIVWSEASYLVDSERTAARKQSIRKKANRLFSKKHTT